VRRRRRLGGLSAALEDVAAAVKRARSAREPYVRTYDASGQGTTLDPGSEAAKSALQAANALLEGVDDLRKLHEKPAADG
jgi:hypothetical protein